MDAPHPLPGFIFSVPKRSWLIRAELKPAWPAVLSQAAELITLDSHGQRGALISSDGVL